MPSQIESIFADFCDLSRRKKSAQFSAYQDMLSEAYTGEITFHLPINERGLEEEGGRLLGWFFERYPHIEEVHLKGNMVNAFEGRRLISGIGFDALTNGLMHLKKLRVLDLSGDKYTPEQLGRLTKDVLMNHPTFTALKLTTAFITDGHLDAITPYLSCPQLKRINLNGNDRHLTGDDGVFNRFVDKLLSACPAIQFVDVSGNTAIKMNGPAAVALMRLVTTNQKVFIRIPQDPAVYQQSMRNHYEHFIPSQFSLMDMEYNRMRAQFEEFEKTTEGLPELITTIRQHEVRFIQIDKRIEDVRTQNEQIQQQIQDAIQLQCLKQILIEKQIAIIHANVRDFKEDINGVKERLTSTEASVRELEVRSESFAVDASHITEGMSALRRNVARQTDAIENLDERMEQTLGQLRTLFNNLEQRMQERWATITASISIEEINPDFSPAEQAYAKKFKYLLVQMHIVAMTATEGTMQLGNSDAASMALMVLNIVTSMAPGPVGTPIQAVFGYLLQSMDEKNTRQRMGQIAQLGAESAEIARLATTLSQRLLHCLALEHYVKTGGLTKLLSVTEDIMHSFAQNGFYGALFHAVQEGDALLPLNTAIKRAFTIPEIERRAEQDAKLLLAAVVKEGVPKGADMMTVDIHRLFLYAAPMLTVVDQLFLTILQNFCTSERCEFNNIGMKAKKRQQFYGAVAKSFHNRAEVVSIEIEHTQETFVEKLATTYSTRQHADGTVGVFYFKTQQTLFAMSQKRHASMRNQALDALEIEEVLNQVLTPSSLGK